MAGTWWWFFAMNRTQHFQVAHQVGDARIYGQQGQALTEGPAEGLTVETGKEAIVILRFDDGGITRVLPATKLAITRAGSNRSSDRFVTSFKLDAGEITSRIPRGDGRTRKVSMVTDSVDIGVRGTEFTVRDEPGVSRLMVTRGKVHADGASGSGVEVVKNYGTVIETGRAPSPPVELPPPPTPLTPSPAARIGDEPMLFEWAPPPGIQHWELAIARDAEFLEQIARYKGRGASFTQEANLSRDGRYFWRVASVDSHGLRGKWSEARPMEYRYFHDRGKSALKELQGKEALEYFQNAQDGWVEELELLQNQAWRHMQAREYDSARVNLDVLTDLLPDAPYSVLGYAQLDVREGRYARALKRLQPLLDGPGHGAAALETAAMAAIGLQEEERAMEFIAMALAMDPQSPAALVLKSSLESASSEAVLPLPGGPEAATESGPQPGSPANE